VGGILGKLSFESDETLARPVLDQRLDVLRHRGLNGRGVHGAPGIALAGAPGLTSRSRRPGWPPRAAMVPKVLLTPRSDGRGIVSRPALKPLWDEHCTGRRDHSHRLWSLLMLEFWFREFIDGDAAEEPAEYAVLTLKAA